MITIKNCKGLEPNMPGILYCGRDWAGWKGSILCNPHPTKSFCSLCKKYHTKEDCIETFRKELLAHINACLDFKGDYDETPEELKPSFRIFWAICNSIQEDTTLGCWCVNKRADQIDKAHYECHCEVLIKAREYLFDLMRQGL